MGWMPVIGVGWFSYLFQQWAASCERDSCSLAGVTWMFDIFQLWDGATQLGKAFSSNNSGDGPEGDETTMPCNLCRTPAPVLQRACDKCYGGVINFPQSECAVYIVRTQPRSRRRYDEVQAEQGNEFIDSSEGTGVYESLRVFRDLRRWPLQTGEWLCRQQN